jgi:hypothetical protein
MSIPPIPSWLLESAMQQGSGVNTAVGWLAAGFIAGYELGRSDAIDSTTRITADVSVPEPLGEQRPGTDTQPTGTRPVAADAHPPAQSAPAGEVTSAPVAGRGAGADVTDTTSTT